jgi:excinuclease ABC subunit A
MRPMAERICESFLDAARRLTDLGLSYLALDRAASTLSTGERQRMQLARAVRNRTTGVLYVLDEPSIGLHPSNLEGLCGVMDDLVADGNSVLVVDHDPRILAHAGWIIELGPGAGAAGGRLVAQGTPADLAKNPGSLIGPFLARDRSGTGCNREQSGATDCNRHPQIRLSTSAIHTVKPLKVSFPRGVLTVVTGVSGSGKTTLVLESLVPALEAAIASRPLPGHVRSVSAPGIARVKLIDAMPIGINIRSTVATYADVHDELRKIYARSPEARARHLKAGDFSYNTGSLRCPTCDGTGQITLDVQFLPDVDIPCPDCRGSRYAPPASAIHRLRKDGTPAATLPELMAMGIDQALEDCADLPLVRNRLAVLRDLGLGYLTLGEATPGLSGGEAQRLKLAEEMGRGQSDTLFVFDEPTIGLHPLDVRTLLAVFRHLVTKGATVVVIEHDLDVIRAADWIIDMGPGGGDDGGRIVATCPPSLLPTHPDSLTGRYI